MASRRDLHLTTARAAKNITGQRNAGTNVGRVLLVTREVLTNRGVVAAFVIASVLLYVHNGTQTIDYQEFDEASYFYRAFLLVHGNVAGARIADPGAMPLYIFYYAFWYLALRTSYVYPIVLTTSILLLGLGAYALLSRIFHPVLSWVLAMLVVAWSVPFAPNCLYIFATGCLWLSLAVLGRHVWQRGLAAALVTLCVLVRPDFLACAATLTVLLALYEVRLMRRHQLEWRALATAYAPLVTLLLLGLSLYASDPQTFQGASSYSIAWSYTDFYRWVHPQQFDPLYSYANPWKLFQQDFGSMPAHPALMQTLLAMTHNPPMLGQYLTFESSRLLASFGTATLDATKWHYDHLQTQPVPVTQRDTLWFLAGGAVFAVIAAASYLALRRQRMALAADLPAKIPVILGLASLIGLVPFMILINAHQRFYMLYPLVLLPAGLGIEALIRSMVLYARLPENAARVARGGMAIAAVLLMLAYLPQPFAKEPPSGPFDAITLAFLREHVPAGSTIIGDPADSYADYLIGDGHAVTGINASTYQGIGDGNVLNNIVKANHSLDNVYILFDHNISYRTGNNPWFTAWNAVYPEIPISLVAQRDNPYVAVYRLPPELGARVSYLQLLHSSGTPTPASSALPPYTAVDFSARVSWTGDLPQNVVTPQYWNVFGWSTYAILLYPDVPGTRTTRAHTVTATLPDSWSGQTVVFAGAFAPWEVGKRGADGTQLVVTIPGTRYTQVVQLPNSPNPQWQPFLVRLPRYAGTATLQITVLPRSSLLWDDTMLSFVGLTTGTPSAGNTGQKAG